MGICVYVHGQAVLAYDYRGLLGSTDTIYNCLFLIGVQYKLLWVYVTTIAVQPDFMLCGQTCLICVGIEWWDDGCCILLSSNWDSKVFVCHVASIWNSSLWSPPSPTLCTYLICIDTSWSLLNVHWTCSAFDAFQLVCSSAIVMSVMQIDKGAGGLLAWP